MNSKPIPALLTTALLAACGGGGGGGLVQAPPPPTVVVNPPPPSGTEPEPCMSPPTADCVANVASSVQMLDGRTSDYALRKQGAGDLRLETGTYRYGAGTTVEAGRLVINSVARLESNTRVEAGATLEVWGVHTGDIDIRGSVTQSAMVEGNVANHGQLNVDGSIWEPLEVIITGDYLQARNATLAVILGTQPGGLTVKGRADIEGGVLRLGNYTDAWGPYPLPATPSTHRVLHADGGVFGTFDEWTSSLFITGALRYLTNDIYFDATSISAQAVMKTANAGDALTLQTAGRYDAALAVPRNTAALTQTQQQFLQNAAAIQRIDNFAQAMRTFDSLSGHGHIAAAEATMTQAFRTAPTLSQHAANGIAKSGAWTAAPDTMSLQGGTFSQGRTYGYDIAFNNGLVMGSSVAWTTANLDMDREGGRAHGDAPQWNLYLHRARPDGWHTTGTVGYSHQRLAMDRPIDLGIAVRTAHAERTFDLAYAYAEGGRDFTVGGGRLTPFAALHATTMRGDAFTETGDTGFELIGQASQHVRSGGDIGARYTRDWQWRGGDRWMRMDLAARYRHLFAVSDDLQAAFAGAPELMFDIGGLPVARNERAWSWTLTGGANDRLAWMMRYEALEDDQALALGLSWAF
jgi:autotransporter-associated beta strand protein